MTSVSAARMVDAPPDRVFSFVTDPRNFGAYVDGYLSGRTLTEHASGPGAVYEWTAAVGPLRLTAVEEVVDWTPASSVAYRGRLARTSFSSSLRVSPARPGLTDLRAQIDYRLPALLGGRLTDTVVKRLVRAHLERSLEKASVALSEGNAQELGADVHLSPG